LVYSLWVYRW